MATVTGLTAARMAEIEAASVVDGEVVGNDLILTTHGGIPINAGNVRGPTGPAGTSVTIQGSVANAAALPTGLGPSDAGKGWITNDNGHLHVWSGTAFTDVGEIRGPAGATGSTGATGPGVAAGGTAGQILSKVDATNYNTQWITAPYANKTPVVGTGLATSGTVNLDLSTLNDTFQTMGALTGDITFTTSNLTAGRSTTIRVVNGATLRVLTFPAWVFVGTPMPANIAASKTGILTITSFGTTDADVVAAWAAQL